METISNRRISLNGEWRFALDPDRQGQWAALESDCPADTIQVPGSWEEQGFGEKPKDMMIGTWTKRCEYVGQVWYVREIEIPTEWSGDRVELELRGVRWICEVSLDGNVVDTGESLLQPHRFDLTPFIRAGKKQKLALRIDNEMKLPLEESHVHSLHTASTWGGITGGAELVRSPQTRIEFIRIEPNAAARSVTLTVDVTSETALATVDLIHIEILAVNGDADSPVVTAQGIVDNDGKAVLTVMMGEAARLWSDRDPFLYSLQVKLLRNDREIDRTSRRFGLRTIRAKGKQILLNDEPVFLRGYVDCSVFPLTGYPVWDKEHYSRQFRIARSYGFNHVRLHSWTAPAPFWEAADEEGMLVQTELPHWSVHYFERNVAEPKEIHSFLRRELERVVPMLNAHPSFVLLSIGNELIKADGHPGLNELVNRGRELDPTRLYTDNTGFGELPAVGREGDFFIPSLNWHVPQRTDLSATPDTREDFRSVTQAEASPILAHEHGQYTMYVRPSEAEKYTGVFEPSWLHSVEESLEKKGLTPRIDSFIEASGTHFIRSMKENIERMRRTPGLSGFQYLDLRDFPGQGHNTIGLLDMFWDSKGLIEPETFRAINDERVLLMRSDVRTVHAGESIEAEIELSNFGAGPCGPGKLTWRLHSTGGVMSQGTLRAEAVPAGCIGRLGTIITATPPDEAHAWTLSVVFEWEGGQVCNEWEFWSFPRTGAIPGQDRIFNSIEALHQALPDAKREYADGFLTSLIPRGTELAIVSQLTGSILQYAMDGGKVWLMSAPEGQYDEVTTRYIPPFWSFLWFPTQIGHTMGMKIEQHPALGKFPNDGFSNWHWYHLVDMASAISLDTIPHVEPIVEVVDNFNRSKRLAYVFEAKIGKGSLFVSTLQLTADDQRKRPETAFLTREIIRYLTSDYFQPAQELTIGEVLGIFKLNIR